MNKQRAKNTNSGITPGEIWLFRITVGVLVLSSILGVALISGVI